MLRVTSLTKYQAFRWLWRFDAEAKWFWFWCFIKGSDLREDVMINLNDFGVCKRVDYYEMKRQQLKWSTRLEF
tara:strand:+ start:1630 stop:1848 length:219 start_codon:yes stop_codon:yes gene_type:complete